MKSVKKKVLEKIKTSLNKRENKLFYWDSLIEWFAYVRALSDFKLLTKEEAKEIIDFIDKNSV